MKLLFSIFRNGMGILISHSQDDFIVFEIVDPAEMARKKYQFKLTHREFSILKSSLRAMDEMEK